MSKIFKVLLIFIAIIVLSVILTVPIHTLLPFFKFEKIFNRLVMIFAVAAAAFFVWFRSSRSKKAFLAPESWREYGFDFSSPWRRLFLYGFLAGALMVFSVAVFEVAFGPRYLREPLLLQDIVERFVKGMVSGMTVGLVEEFFFRGFIFVSLMRKMSVLLAVFLTSIFYSLTHFLDNGQIFIPPAPSMGDAVRLLFGYLEPMARRPLEILPEFAGLFLFGVLLNIAFIRTRSLFLPIGIHAGAVFLIKWHYSFVREGPEIYHPFFGAPPFYDGLVEWLFLILLGCVIWRMTVRVDR